MNARSMVVVLALMVLGGCRCETRLMNAPTECMVEDTRPCDTGLKGLCGEGVQSCVDGSWAGCAQTVTATTEICNMVDDDCDGDVDEGMDGMTCGVGACRRTTSACMVEATCTPGEPSEEVCDGIDNDCDGETDEGLPMLTCGDGLCENQTASCSNGTPATCAPKMPGAEVCDGIDNDCDGTVDEDLLTNVSNDVRITNDPAASDYVYATWGGNRLGVVWADRRDGNEEIYFVALDSLGRRQTAQDRRITNTSAASTHPAVAWTGSEFLVVWAEGATNSRNLMMQRVQADGTMSGSPKAITNSSGSSDWPDIVWTGSELAVAWQDNRSNNTDIYFARFDSSGNRQGGEVRITTDDAVQRGPVLKKGNNDFAVVWTDHRHGNTNLEIYMRRISGAGQAQGSEVRVSNAMGESSWPDLAYNGNGWAVVWQDERFGDGEIFLSRFTSNLSPVGETRITNAGGVSGYPSIDWNGTQYGLSWNDDRAGSAAVYFAAVNELGMKNGGDTKISSADAPGTSQFTTALWTGSFYAFLWKDTRDAPQANSEVYFAQVGCPASP